MSEVKEEKRIDPALPGDIKAQEILESYSWVIQDAIHGVIDMPNPFRRKDTYIHRRSRGYLYIVSGGIERRASDGAFKSLGAAVDLVSLSRGDPVTLTFRVLFVAKERLTYPDGQWLYVLDEESLGLKEDEIEKIWEDGDSVFVALPDNAVRRMLIYHDPAVHDRAKIIRRLSPEFFVSTIENIISRIPDCFHHYLYPFLRAHYFLPWHEIPREYNTRGKRVALWVSNEKH